MNLSAHVRADEFETTALPHLNELYRTAMRTLRDATEASDVVQETFLQAWKSFHRFAPGTNCRAWLYKIMFHVIHHHRRRQFRCAAASVADADLGLEETLRYEPPVPESLRDGDVLRALATLPDHYRDVILLVDVDELSYREAAATLDIPIGTVMSRLSRGRALLRAELADLAPTYGIDACRRRA